jgi:hypothetical protein
MDSSTALALSRSWATNQIWPAGEGPALTQQDYLNIVQADPFVNCSFNNATQSYTSCYFPENNTTGNNFGPPPPVNSADGRFTLLAINGSLTPYTMGGPSTPYNQATTSSTTNTQQTNHQTKEAWGLDLNLSFNAFTLFFENQIQVDTKFTQTLNWTHSFQQALTNTTMNTSSFTIAPPPCPNGVCPQYSGPPEFLVYQDNLYGTFVFYPVH